MIWKKASEEAPPLDKKVLVKVRADTDSEYYGPDLGKAVVTGTFTTIRQEKYVHVKENIYKREYSDRVWFDDLEFSRENIKDGYFEWAEFSE